MDTGHWITSLVNPFCAAAATPLSHFNPPKEGVFLGEGIRSLQSIIVIHHLQHILDTLPVVQLSKPKEGPSALVVKKTSIAASACPGMGRLDTISALFSAAWTIRSIISVFPPWKTVHLMVCNTTLYPSFQHILSRLVHICTGLAMCAGQVKA